MIRDLLRAISDLPESRWGLPAAVTFSATLMGALLIVRWNSDLNFDGEIYIAAARKFSAGMYLEAMKVYPMPAYPYLISAVHHFIPNWVAAGRLISYLAMTATTVPVYLLTKTLFDRRAAFWATVSYALLPQTLLHSCSVLRDPAFFPFSIAAVYYSVRTLESRRKLHLFLSALFAWSSSLFRMEGLAIFPVLLGAVSLASLRNGFHKDFRKLLITGTALFALFLMLIHLAISNFGETVNRYNDLVSLWERLRNQSFFENYRIIAEQLQGMQEQATYSDVGQHFASTAKQLIPFIYGVALIQMLIKVTVPSNLMVLGWGVTKSKFDERQILVVVLIVLSLIQVYGFLIMLGLVIERYVYPVVLMTIPWIGVGFCRIQDYFRRRRYGKFIVAFIISILLAIPVSKFDKYFTSKDELKSKTGAWIAGQELFKRSLIIFSDPGVKFHSSLHMGFCCEENMVLHQVPDDRTFAAIAQAALKISADAIVIYTRTERRGSLADFKGYVPVIEFDEDGKLIRVLTSKAPGA